METLEELRVELKKRELLCSQQNAIIRNLMDEIVEKDVSIDALTKKIQTIKDFVNIASENL